VRILLVSSMYPGPTAPDLGVFVADLERALAARGHKIEHTVIDTRRGGRRRYLELGRKTRVAARRFRPDVVYAHFLVPPGLIAALASRAPLVLTAHGQDVRNVGEHRGAAAATRFVVRRAAAVVCVSEYLRRELVAQIPDAAAKTDVVDCGVDLDRFAPSNAAAMRAELGWEGAEPSFLCVGSLTGRKNVVRLADAFARLGEGQLAFVGDGPARAQLEGRGGVRLVGAVPHEEVSRWIAASDVVCQPSLVEPFGQSLLEAMASGRSVVATKVGGPPEFVTAEAGVLVDPEDEASIEGGLRRAAALPRPNLAARAAAEPHDVRLQAERIEAILTRALEGRAGRDESG
jgi:glycosyltransferase involved in cell wall biosynthesis